MLTDFPEGLSALQLRILLVGLVIANCVFGYVAYKVNRRGRARAYPKTQVNPTNRYITTRITNKMAGACS